MAPRTGGRLGGIAAVLAVASALLAAPAGAAGVFGPPEQIDTGAGATCPGPDVAAAADGATTVVYQKAGTQWAATRPAGGAWSPVPLGTGARGTLSMSADGDALNVWRASNVVRTASKAPGGAWDIPAPGDPGTFAATSLLSAAGGTDSEGRAVVAWFDQLGPGSFALRFALRDATGVWSAPADAIIPAGGVRAFGSPHAFLDDTGAVVLAFQDVTAPPASRAFARLLRRDPATGGWSSAELTPTTANIGTFNGSCNNNLDAAMDPVTGRLIVGYGIDPAGTSTPSRYQVWEGSSSLAGGLKVDSPSLNTPPYQAVAVRPGGVSGAAVSAHKADPAGDNQDIQGFAGPSWAPFQTPTSVNSTVSSMGVARTTGLDVAAIYTYIDADAPPGEIYKVRGVARDPGGAWAAPVTITTGSNYGGVNMAADGAGGATGVWVDTDDKIWSVPFFGGPPLPDGGTDPAGKEPPPGAFSPDNTIIGTPGDDVLQGTPGSDLIIGLGGRDRIDGLGGNDTVLGGSGDDVLKGGPGRDKLLGGDGDDRLDTVDGGERDDAQAGSGEDLIDIEVPLTLAGKARASAIKLTALRVAVDAGAMTGISAITAGALKPLCAAADVCNGAGSEITASLGLSGSNAPGEVLRRVLGTGTGRELPTIFHPAIQSALASLSDAPRSGLSGIVRRAAGVVLSEGQRAELGRDLRGVTGRLTDLASVLGKPSDTLGEISGSIGSLSGESRKDGRVAVEDDGALKGTAGNDILVGSGRGDRIDAGAGDDIVLPVGGNDRVDAGSGDDLVIGSGGGDRLAGGAGDDHISAGGGEDRVDLGSGNDSAAIAGGGADGLNTGSGTDLIGTGTAKPSAFLGASLTVTFKSGKLAAVEGPGASSGLGKLCKDSIGVCLRPGEIGTGFGTAGDSGVGAIASALRVPLDRIGGGLGGSLLGRIGPTVSALGPRVPELSVVRPGIVPVNPDRSLSTGEAQGLLNAVAPFQDSYQKLMQRALDAVFKTDELTKPLK